MSTIRFQHEGDVGSIVLANPPRNELGRRFADDLLAVVHEASSSSIRALIIRAEGPNFGTGGDVPEMAGKECELVPHFHRRGEPGLCGDRGASCTYDQRRPWRCRQRSLRALVLRADLIIASDTATFAWVESETGFTPLAGGLQRLAERVGRGRAAAHVMMAETIDAAEARRIGLVHRVVTDAELDSAADELGASSARGATRGYAADRALLKAWSSGGVAGADDLMLDLSMDLYTSVDTRTRSTRSRAQRGVA